MSGLFFWIWTIVLSLCFPAAGGSIGQFSLVSVALAEDAMTAEPVKWQGPVLWYHPEAGPLSLVLVEKGTQTLRHYRFDGAYELVKAYAVSTGENAGKKQREKDKKTPEGIYFNNKTYRDKQVTIFGNRAFGLNYPDPFDRFENNGGHGIFIHGSDKSVTPYSTNGCVVMDNRDLEELDPHIQPGSTPVIIGERLPYRFGSTSGAWDELMPFFESAMIPHAQGAGVPRSQVMAIIGYADRVVVMGRVFSKESDPAALCRLYLVGPSERLMVLVDREWEGAGTGVDTVRGKDGELAALSMLEKDAVLGNATAKEPAPQGEIERVKQTLAAWRASWQSKDIDAYMAHYHIDFVGGGRGRDEWRARKHAVNMKYRSISVALSDLEVRVEGDRAFAGFFQRYRSDRHDDRSYKVLELKKQNDRWLIFRETAYAEKPTG